MISKWSAFQWGIFLSSLCVSLFPSVFSLPRFYTSSIRLFRLSSSSPRRSEASPTKFHFNSFCAALPLELSAMAKQHLLILVKGWTVLTDVDNMIYLHSVYLFVSLRWTNTSKLSIISFSQFPVVGFTAPDAMSITVLGHSTGSPDSQCVKPLTYCTTKYIPL